MNLRELGSWWSESLGATASDRTRKLYTEAVDHLCVWLDQQEQGSDEVPDRRTLDRYFAEFRQRPNRRTGKPLSPAYVQQHWRSLQQFYKWLKTEELIERDPFVTGMQKIELDEVPVPVFTEDELTRLFKVTEGKDRRSRRDRAILRMLVDTGIRVGELVGIEREHVDYAQKLILVTGKRRKSRRVPFNTKLYSELRRWEMVRPSSTSELLFVGLRGRGYPPLTTSGIRQLLESIGERAGISDMHPHRFRHTFAHMWMLDGGLETELMRLMGWSSTQMAQLYGASASTERAQGAARRRAIGDRF